MSSTPDVQLPEVALGEIPARKGLLYQLQCILIATYTVSGFLLIFGLAAVLVTAPDYEYPISVGGGCFFAITGFAHSVVSNLHLIEARKPLSPSGEESVCYRRITWSGTQWIVLWTNVIGFLLSMVFSAVFPMNTCIKRLSEKNVVCNPNPVTNLVLALFVFVLSLLLMGLQVVFNIKKRSDDETGLSTNVGGRRQQRRQWRLPTREADKATGSAVHSNPCFADKTLTVPYV